MKIERIELYPLVAQLDEPFGWSQRWTNQRATVVVKIIADDGCHGWGESSELVALQRLAPLLIGTDPTRSQALWQRLYGACYQDHGFAGPMMAAISALDIALWDLRGKAAGQPVAQLLGGPLREQIPVYATGLYYRADDYPRGMAEEAQRYCEAGFSGMKMKIGGKPLAEDIRRVYHLRQVIGDEVRLMVDANEAYDLKTALAVARKLGDADLTWFEEPCGSYFDAANLSVRQQSSMPIAGGESLKTRWEFAPRLANRTFDIIQPDVVFVGGISELANVAAMASAFGVTLNPHFWGTGISLSATLHLAACLPSLPPGVCPQPYVSTSVVELDCTPHPIREHLTDPVFNACDSALAVPSGPGLGIEVRPEILARFLQGQMISVSEADRAGLAYGR